MSTTVEVEVDEANRILIPVELQNRLGLQPGMTLVVEEGQSGVALHVQSGSALLVDKGGVLVAQVERIGDITDVVHQERERQALDPAQRERM
jgi:bifunctional DNA-binding transcriptional regulator/antitoxin component of YhaV-PrlF toxin-antitoxin module